MKRDKTIKGNGAEQNEALDQMIIVRERYTEGHIYIETLGSEHIEATGRVDEYMEDKDNTKDVVTDDMIIKHFTKNKIMLTAPEQTALQVKSYYYYFFFLAVTRAPSC